MNTAAFIADRAAIGWSRNMVAQALGIRFGKLKTILEVMPEVKWEDPRKSAAVLDSYRMRRGVCIDGAAERLAVARAARKKALPHFNVGSCHGTVPELCAYWVEFLSVTECQVRRRVKQGWAIHDALFKPVQTRKGVVMGF